MSTSSSHIDHWSVVSSGYRPTDIARGCGRSMLWLVVCGLSFALASPTFAQGRSIPKSSEVAPAPDEEQAAALPAGQKYRYQKFYGLSVSVNVFEPVMEVFKNDFAAYEAMATLDLYHRYMPQVVFGMAHCDDKSVEGVRYHVAPTPYFKLGCGYNFKYNDWRPDDFYYVMLRYGFSVSHADVENLRYRDGYWGEYGPASIVDQKFPCHYVELGGGIRVKLRGRLSLGWELWYKNLLARGDNPYGAPHYVPGYGKTSGHLGFSFLATFNLR